MPRWRTRRHSGSGNASSRNALLRVLNVQSRIRSLRVDHEVPMTRTESREFLAEQRARQRLLRVREQISELEAHSWLDAPGAIEE